VVPVSSEAFRQVLGRFAAGVTIVTTRADGEVHGTTMSAFSSLSLEPPLVLIAVRKESDIHGLIARSKIFAVNILHKGQSETSAAFAQKGTLELIAAHRLEGTPFRVAVTGAPVLKESLAYLDCRVTQSVDAGDHTIYIGRVEEGDVSSETDVPLVYYRGRYESVVGPSAPGP